MVTPCESWDGHHRKSDGRPMMWEDGVLVYVYRSRYQKERGKIPKGMILHHECENPRCVNIRHLELITRAEHLKRHDLHANHRFLKKNTCPRGHVYDRANATQRICSICVNEAKRRKRAETRAAQ